MSDKCSTCARNKGGKRCNRVGVGTCTHYKKYTPIEVKKPSEWGFSDGAWKYLGETRDNKKK